MSSFEFIIEGRDAEGRLVTAPNMPVAVTADGILDVQRLNVPKNKIITFKLFVHLKNSITADQNGTYLTIKFKDRADVKCALQNNPCIISAYQENNWVGQRGPTFAVRTSALSPNNQQASNDNGADFGNINIGLMDAGAYLDRAADLIKKVTVSEPMQPIADQIEPGLPYSEVLKIGLNPDFNAGLTGVKLKILFDTPTQATEMEGLLGLKLFLLNKNRIETELTRTIQYFVDRNQHGSGAYREKLFTFPKVTLTKQDLFSREGCPCTLVVKVMQNGGDGQRFQMQALDYQFDPNPQPAFEGDKLVQGGFFTLVAEAQEVGAGAAGGSRGGAIGGLGSVGSFGSSGVLPDGEAVGIRPNAGAGNGGSSVGANGVNVNFPGGNLGGLGAAGGQIKNPSVGPSTPNLGNLGNIGRTLQEATARAAAERTRLAQEQSAREEAARQQAERDRLAREQSAREQAARVEAARQQALADEAARALAAAQQARDLAAQQQAAAEMAAAQDARNRALAAQAEYERQVAALNAASEYAAQRQRAAEEAQKDQAASQQTTTQTAGQQNETTAHTAAAAASDGTTDRIASGSATAPTSLGQPNLEYSARLAYAPERGSTGPAANLYFLIAGLSPAMVAFYRKMRKQFVFIPHTCTGVIFC